MFRQDLTSSVSLVRLDAGDFVPARRSWSPQSSRFQKLFDETRSPEPRMTHYHHHLGCKRRQLTVIVIDNELMELSTPYGPRRTHLVRPAAPGRYRSEERRVGKEYR